MRKPRSDSKLLNLPEEQQAQLAEWLLSGVPYHRAMELCQKEFEVKTCFAALSRFWNAVCQPALLARRAQAVRTADAVAEEAKKTPGAFDAATLDAIRQKAFELSISPQAAPREVKALFMLLLKARGQDLDAQELKLHREKFEFDAARAALAQLGQLRHIAQQTGLDERAKLQAARAALFGDTP
jgi:hypothetical protein